jgi:predicted  nucleic acid-binding Zn-ribbon protein
MIISDLERHITELQSNISKIAYRMVHLEEAPKTNDPLIQQLRDLDFKGWTLHEEQWKLQLTHLRFAEELLREVQKTGQGASHLFKKWGEQRQQYENNLETYRHQRHAIEEQRLQIEGKMIGRYLQ